MCRCVFASLVWVASIWGRAEGPALVVHTTSFTTLACNVLWHMFKGVLV